MHSNIIASFTRDRKLSSPQDIAVGKGRFSTLYDVVFTQYHRDNCTLSTVDHNQQGRFSRALSELHAKIICLGTSN